MCAIAAAAASDLLAQNVPTGFTVDTIASGLNTPHDFCFTPDGRCLVANSGGSVSLVANGTFATIGTVPSVLSGGESGLLSIAADPQFGSNGYVYVYYCSNADSVLHIDRFTCTGALANPTSTNVQLAAGSRRVVLANLPNVAPHHNGGSLRFGPDGMLYVSVGDDNDSCNTQVPGAGVGCLLRLDVASLPAGGSLVAPSFSSLDPGNNPMSSATDFTQLVIGHGLRNPFRMEIDPLTGNVFLGDVGESLVEEVDVYPYSTGTLPLRNYGWPFREGDIVGPTCGGTPPPGLTDPILALSRANGWGTLIGGPCYRNLGTDPFGTAYEGNVFYLDFWTGNLQRAVETATGWVVAPAVPGQPTPTSWGSGFAQVSSLRLGPDGSLWYSQHSWTGGELCRIRRLGPTNSLVAVSGDGQRVALGDAFPQPLVVRAFDGQGNALPNAVVSFAVSGPAWVLPATPITTDANGYAQVNAAAWRTGGVIRVTATCPAATNSVGFDLYVRKLTATYVAPLLSVQVNNQTSATPPQVPYALLMSFPGSPTVSSPFGTLCIDPTYALAIVLEDSTGAFGGGSISGTGSMGNPNLSKLYGVPNGLLNGWILRFLAIGNDPVTGWFRTNCQDVRF